MVEPFPKVDSEKGNLHSRNLEMESINTILSDSMKLQSLMACHE